MKQNIKIFVIALIIGIGVSFIFCYKKGDVLITNAINPEGTYLYVGSYNNLESATLKQKDYPNSLIYNDKGIYKVVIGIYSKEETIDLMETYFNDQNINFKTGKIKVTSNFLSTIQNYELLITSSSIDYYNELNLAILKAFNEYIN